MRIRRVVIVVPLIVLALALAGGFTWLWRFFVLLAVVLALSYVWSRLSARSIDGRAKKPSDRCQVGESLEEEFTVSNHSRVPSPLIEAREDTDLPGYRNTVAFSLAAYESRSWRTLAGCRRRGIYSVGGLTVRVSDPLGLFPVEKTLGNCHDVIVYPQTLELPFFQALPRQEPGQSPRRWMASEAGPSAARVRDYTSGDSLRHIHWHTTAHTGRLMVREFEPDRSSYNFKNIWIVPDMHRASRFGEGDATTEEYAITIAASLAKKYISSGKQVGLLAAGDRSYLSLPEAGDEHLRQILLSLALMKAEGEIPMDTLLASQLDRFEAGSAVVVIMPPVRREVAEPLRRAMNYGVIVTVILLDPISFGGETGTESMARSLVSSGLHVYVMRRGAEISRALDSRLHYARV
jgi:uncharacterized protein (DUF58 family)